MRVGVLSNSHGLMLRNAWKDVRAEVPGVELAFFPATRRGIAHGMRVDKSLVVVNDVPEGAEPAAPEPARPVRQLDLRTVDAVIIGGMLRDARGLMRLHAAYRAESHRADAGSATLVSDALFLELARAERDASLAIVLARQIRAFRAMPVVVIPHPYPSADVRRNPDLAALHETGDAALLMDLFLGLNAELAAEFAVVAQPEETLEAPLFTKPVLTQGSGFWAHPERPELGPNLYHMNAQFGEMVLRLALRELQEAPRPGGPLRPVAERAEPLLTQTWRTSAGEVIDPHAPRSTGAAEQRSPD